MRPVYLNRAEAAGAIVCKHSSCSYFNTTVKQWSAVNGNQLRGF